MTFQDLLPLLQQLNRADKVRVLEFVSNELAAEELLEALASRTTEFEIWSPYDSAEAARQLYALLERAI